MSRWNIITGRASRVCIANMTTTTCNKNIQQQQQLTTIGGRMPPSWFVRGRRARVWWHERCTSGERFADHESTTSSQQTPHATLHSPTGRGCSHKGRSARRGWPGQGSDARVGKEPAHCLQCLLGLQRA
eukprot:5323861-Pyramimonas_sp.AAC.1